jgi:hypothetical protein
MELSARLKSPGEGRLCLSKAISVTSGWHFTCLLCVAALMTASANAQTISPAPSPQIERNAQRLSQSGFDRQIEKVLQNPEFGWRQPGISHAKADPTVQNWIASIGQALSFFRNWFAGVWRHFISFLRNFRAGPPMDAAKGVPFAPGLLNLLEYLLLAGIAGTLILLAIRLLKTKRIGPPILIVAPKNPDPADEGLAADERPEDEWYKLAREKIASGEFRLAQRAIFLAILSCLGSRRLITIERWKSNCDYESELSRRAKHLPELPQLYGQCREGFERCWYGEGILTPRDLDTYGRIYERIRNAVA